MSSMTVGKVVVAVDVWHDEYNNYQKALSNSIMSSPRA